MKSFLQLVVGFVMLLLAAKIIFTIAFMVFAMLFKAVLTVAVAFIAVVTVVALIGAIFRSL